MEKKVVVLCDTNIIIEFYKKNEIVINNLKTIGQENIAVSIITVGELLFGALNKRELAIIRNDLAHLHILYQTPEIGKCFFKLMSDYSLSHKLSLPDGMIAATAITEDIQLYTHNSKDFKFISGITLFKEKPEKH